MLCGAFFGFSGVALGAFGAHGLRRILSPDMIALFETAVRYQLYHTFAIFISAFLAERPERRYASYSGAAFIAGILLFSGSLYALALSGVPMLGMITPLGGIAFLVGWIFLFLAAFKMHQEN